MRSDPAAPAGRIPAMPATPSLHPSTTPRLRVMHFVSGGFSGATQVAVSLAQADLGDPACQTMLVLRTKRQTDPTRVDALRQSGLELATVPGALRLHTLWRLYRLCQQHRPDVLVAHGYPEHLIGRLAGWLAGVPRLIQVEHNSRERYGRWSRWQTRWLARYTQAIVGVSDGVKTALLQQGLPPSKVHSIPNGIRLDRFAAAPPDWSQRREQIVMCARFSAQKDHATLIRAVAELAKTGHPTPLLLAGGGKASHRRKAERLADELGVAHLISFLGNHDDVPRLLAESRYFVLSTHYEGMPLAMIEAMAAGCAVVGSDVIGVKELIQPSQTGLLCPEGDSLALAAALRSLMQRPEYAQAMAGRARQAALSQYAISSMMSRYASLIRAQGQEPTPEPQGKPQTP
jgi:glycosyltransferase involved in cell wall biosynthesis